MAWWCESGEGPEWDAAVEGLLQRHREALAAWELLRSGEKPGWRTPASRLQEFIQEASEQSGDMAALETLQAGVGEGRDWAYELYQQLRLDDSTDETGNFASDLTTKLRDASRDWAGGLADQLAAALTNVSGMLNLALDLILIPIYSFFLLIAMPTFRTRIRGYLPRNENGTLASHYS